MKNKFNRRAILKTGAAAVGTLAAPSILSANVVFNKPMVAALNAPAGDPTNVSIARIPELMKKNAGLDLNLEVSKTFFHQKIFYILKISPAWCKASSR